jgi:hypothetical protein
MNFPPGQGTAKESLPTVEMPNRSGFVPAEPVYSGFAPRSVVSVARPPAYEIRTFSSANQIDFDGPRKVAPSLRSRLGGHVELGWLPSVIARG